MIAHVVLFTPRAGLPEEERAALVAALERACRDIPGIQRATVGRRRVLGYAYDTLSPVSFDYAAVLEFASQSALAEYLQHPAHVELGTLFHQVSQVAIAHDFEMADATAAGEVRRIAALD
ncbi:MAG: Dabb family protein [Vicinamibacterales bacterium]